MANLAEMREFLRKAYPGREWKRKVDRMPERQVYCIFTDIQKRNKKKEAEKQNDILHHQYTVDEWLEALQKKGENNNEESTEG